MELSNYELEIILQAVRNERSQAERNYIQAMKTEMDTFKNGNDERLLYGVADRLTVLQRFNNLMIKLEDELQKRHNSVF